MKKIRTSGFFRRIHGNFLLMMRLTMLFLLMTFVSLTATALGQRTTIKLDNVDLQVAFNEIKQKMGYTFVYNDQVVKNVGKVSVNVTSSDIKYILAKCLEGTSLDFYIEDNIVVIKSKAEQARETERKPVTVKGKVVDEKKQPLPGVTVLLKGTTLGVTTGGEGDFSIVITDTTKAELVFSFIGMVSQTIPYKSIPKGEWTIVLKDDVQEMDEVVVTGIYSRKKESFTGSSTTYTAKELKTIGNQNVLQSLKTMDPSFAIVENNQFGSDPNRLPDINVRGKTSVIGLTQEYEVDPNQPLFILDGFETTLKTISDLSMDRVQSITVLKDAAATAIYGSKAANGVVIITTKRGRQDMKPQFNFNYYVGVTTPIKEKVLNAAQYKSALQEAATNFLSSREASGRPMTGSQVEQANKILNDPSFFGNADTDWVGLVLRNGITQNVDVSVSGGGKNSKYYTSLSYTGQEGTLIGTDFKRISGKISLDNDIAKWFRLYANLNYGYTKNNLTNGIYGQALTAPPVFAPFNEDGSYAALGDLSSDYRGYQNPLAVAQGTNLAKDYLLKGSLAAEITFLRDFKFKSTVSVSYDAYNQLNYVPSFVEVGGFYGREDSQGGLGTQANSTTINTFFENTLTWDKEFNQNHRLNVLAGTSWEDYRSDYFSATGRGYPDDDILNNLSSAATAVNVKGSNPENRNSLLSFYLRANYIWKDRYLFTFTGRADASSKFAPDNQYGFFPSGAIAWRISQENFMRDAEWIDEIKLRASAGKTGTQSIGDHMWRTLYTTASYGGKNALIPTQLGNDKIKWESTVQKDLGLDFSFWNGRLAGTFGYYHKVTDGALLNLTPAPSSSYPTVVFNIAKVRNEGLEFDVHGDFIRKSNFKWSGALNISRNISKVLDVAGNPFSDPNDRDNLNLGTSVVKEGEPLGLLWGRVATGIIKSEEELAAVKKEMPYWSSFDPYLSIGDVRYEFDETGYWKEDVIGHATPEFFGGYTNTFTWKNLSLLALFTFSYGNDLMYQKDVSDMAMNSLANRGTRVLNHYSENNTASNRPRYVLGNTNMLTSLNVYDASYLKLKSLTLSYNLPKQICQKCRLNALSVYATATNLFTITSYPGPDPEVSDDPTSVIGGGRDVSTYPTVKSYTFGIRFNF